MYITDLKKEFYEYLSGKNIVIVVHYDIDALCTYRILQSLIKYDSIQYTLAPVQNVQDFRTAYADNRDQVKCFVLINCGGTVDIVEELDPPDDVVFFVLDSHRPTDVCNVYSNGQVRLLWTAEDDQGVPEFEDIFPDEDVAQLDDEEEDGEESYQSESDEDGEGRASKRRRLGEEDILKRRQRRLWEEKKNKLMFEYTQYSYYAKASALTMYELALQVGKDNKEVLWLAILAVTEQMLLGKVESSQYAVACGTLQLEVGRVSRRAAADDASSALRVSCEQDLRLALYRHWTVEASLRYSVRPCSKLRLWSLRGERRLQELLVDMSLPLAQSRQKFNAMDLVYRREFHDKLERHAHKYGLGEVAFPSFLLQHNYRYRYTASDMVHAVLALLEQGPAAARPDARFNDALDCLSRSKPALVAAGVHRAKLLLEGAAKVMKTALDLKKVFSAGPFLYFILRESFLDWQLFTRPHSLLLLAQYVQHGYCEKFRGRNSASMPLLVSAPACCADQDQDACLVLGLPPLCENSPKNFFGKAFEQAAERSNIAVQLAYWDMSYVKLSTLDRTRFLDSLTALLS